MNRTDEMVLKFREVLKETERLGPDDLWAYQQSLLTPLLLHARKHTSFYHDRLDAVFDGNEVDYTKWSEIPLLTREQADREHHALRAKDLPPHLGAVKEDETSGSMGRPMRFYINGLADVATLAMNDRMYRWWGFDGAKPIVNFVSPRLKISNSEHTITHGWRSGFLQGLNHVRQSTGDMDSHLDWLCELRPVYVVTYTSMLRPLAQRALARGLNLKFEKIVARGGVAHKDLWPLCKEAFGAELVDQYGANEIGHIACLCRRCGEYHMSAETMLVEVLDEAGEQVKSGETGRVVLTSLYNHAMPFIRYEIGDRARRSDSDKPCDITLPRLSRIAGRYRNNFTLRDGRIIFPNPPMNRFREFFAYKQLQVVQTEYEKIEVRYVPSDEGGAVDEVGLELWLQSELEEDFKVQLIEVDSMSALPSGKFEDFISLVKSRRPANPNG